MELQQTYNANVFENSQHDFPVPCSQASQHVRKGPWIEEVRKGWSRVKWRGWEIPLLSHLSDAGPSPEDTNKPCLLQN